MAAQPIPSQSQHQTAPITTELNVCQLELLAVRQVQLHWGPW